MKKSLFYLWEDRPSVSDTNRYATRVGFMDLTRMYENGEVISNHQSHQEFILDIENPIPQLSYMMRRAKAISGVEAIPTGIVFVDSDNFSTVWDKLRIINAFASADVIVSTGTMTDHNTEEVQQMYFRLGGNMFHIIAVDYDDVTECDIKESYAKWQ